MVKQKNREWLMENSAMVARWQGIGVFFMTNKDTSYKLAPGGAVVRFGLFVYSNFYNNEITTGTTTINKIENISY